jgi:hypothetical protein
MAIHMDFRNDEQRRGVTGPSRLVRFRVSNTVVEGKVQMVFFDGHGNQKGILDVEFDEWLALRAILKVGFEQTKSAMPVAFMLEGESEIINRIAESKR